MKFNFFNLPSGIISCFENSKIVSYLMETIKGIIYKEIFSFSLRTLNIQVLREFIFPFHELCIYPKVILIRF